MSRPRGSCIAWWYLDCGFMNAHCFITVYVHAKREEFSVQIAEGKASMSGFPKNDHIVKPGWSYTRATRRQALARVLKYVDTLVKSRLARGFNQNFFSFSEHTGTSGDAQMLAWELAHDSSPRTTPRPEWWPTRTMWRAQSDDINRASVHEEGFDINELINCARSSVRKRKLKVHGKLARRVGRFTVYAKDTKDAPY